MHKKTCNKKVNAQAILLSSFGTILTAFFCTIFCFYILSLSFIESFLIGAVISSTDAASVFSILRSRRLNLKYNTASLLEMESGSNDPFAYILTILGITMLKGSSTVMAVPLFFKQIIFGVILGVLIAYGAMFLIKKTRLLTEGTDTIFIVATANVIVSENAAKEGHPIGFIQFMKYGVPVVLISLIISSVYVYLRYLN